ncbi:MAG: chromosomal replication initiator protein DnaA [Desulfobacterales bacterium]|nr:chromosomal replication initiator protein DnaA [Desulfobacterales bacterium]
MKKLWSESVEILKTKISEQNISTWINPIHPVKLTGNLLIMEVPNKFIKDWVKDNYKKTIEETLSQVGTLNYLIDIKINKEINKEKNNEPSIANIEKKKEIRKIEILPNINPKYTFDTFVSGTSNQFAHAAAMAVSKNPATTYNPLFIYGGVGLGKTHLINAIGNEIYRNNNSAKICYYSSEKFTNELINSLRHAKMNEFRNKFRSIDVLLIDDIQFIAGKKSTQEEFFHTFNSLYESHKQIIVTSDKFPKEIPELEERLRSRFEWGLIADIQAPDTETKQAILNMKADQNNIKISEDVICFLANSITNNVRELEGYLIRIGAYSSLTSTPITVEMAKKILKDILIESNREITVEKIQKRVADHFQIKTTELKSAKRLKNIVFPRQISMYICRNLTNLSYPEIGSKFGGKDHSTIIYAVKKIEKLMEEDIQIKVMIENMIENLGA